MIEIDREDRTIFADWDYYFPFKEPRTMIQDGEMKGCRCWCKGISHGEWIWKRSYRKESKLRISNPLVPWKVRLFLAYGMWWRASTLILFAVLLTSCRGSIDPKGWNVGVFIRSRSFPIESSRDVSTQTRVETLLQGSISPHNRIPFHPVRFYEYFPYGETLSNNSKPFVQNLM